MNAFSCSGWEIRRKEKFADVAEVEPNVDHYVALSQYRHAFSRGEPLR